MHTDDLLLTLLGTFTAVALMLPIAGYARTTSTSWLVHTSARISAPDVPVVIRRPDPTPARPIVCGGGPSGPDLSLHEALDLCAIDRPTDLHWFVRDGRVTDLHGARTDAQQRCIERVLRFRRDHKDGHTTFALSARRAH